MPDRLAKTTGLLRADNVPFFTSTNHRPRLHRCRGYAAWSPDGTKLAASVGDEIVVYDVETGDQLRALAGHKGIIHSVAWSPDGEKLASGSSDQAVFLWDAETGERLRALRGHTDVVWVWDVAWSPDGTRLASASLDNTIVLWKVTP